MKLPKQNKRANQQSSILESLRDLSNDFFLTTKEELVKKGAKDIYTSLFPFNVPQTTIETPNKTDKQTDFEKRQKLILKRIESIRHQETILFTRQQKETQQQVIALQEEIHKLAISTTKLASEANQAQIVALQETPSAGKYHLGLFEKIRMILAKIRSQIEESSFWLAAWTKKAQKRNYYWRQFKKSGSKFLLSSDRYVSTQAG